jgi:hypothetical protein
MYAADEQNALTRLFTPVTPDFSISRAAMKTLAVTKLSELRDGYPNKELYWIALEDALSDLLEAPTQH